jgi:hypothetical protein
MARRYKLDHFTKGTGASVAPVEDRAAEPRDRELETVRVPAERRGRAKGGERRSSPLPPGHVRKKATGEIGKVQSVDPQAGTARVLWLRSGSTSVVPIDSVSRH